MDRARLPRDEGDRSRNAHRSRGKKPREREPGAVDRKVPGERPERETEVRARRNQAHRLAVAGGRGQVGRHGEGGHDKHRLADPGKCAHSDYRPERRLQSEHEVAAEHERDAAEEEDSPAPAVGQPAGDRTREDRSDSCRSDSAPNAEVALPELVPDVERQRHDEDAKAREDGARRGEDEQERARENSPLGGLRNF